MRILIIGASGYVGNCLCRVLSPDHEVYGTCFRNEAGAFKGRKITCDIRDIRDVERAFQIARPEAVVHLAYDMKDIRGSICQGTEIILDVWKRAGKSAFFLFASTDVVFDGESAPYAEADLALPVVPYGQAKKEAEQIVLGNEGHVFRTSLVYGFDPPDERTRVLFAGCETGSFPYPYFSDEMRCPVYVEDLCTALARILALRHEAPCLVHLAGPESMSRHAFARRLADFYGYPDKVIPKALLAGSEALRPRDISLDSSLAARVPGVGLRSLDEVTGDPVVRACVSALKGTFSP